MRLFLIVLICISSLPAWAGSSNSLMDISTDGTKLACSNRDAGTISIVDLATHKTLQEIPVGLHPEGVTFLGETHNIAVAVYGDDVVLIIDTKTGKELQRIAVYDEPYGIVSNQDGSRLWVTLEYPGRIAEVETSTGMILREATIGKYLRGLAFTQDEQLLTTEYYTGVVKSVDIKTLEVTEEWVGSPQDNLARQITVHPSRQKAYLPHQRALTTIAHGNGSIFPYAAILDLNSSIEKRRKRVQMDSMRGTYVVANPWEVAVSPDGKRFYIVFSGTDDMYACDILDDNYRELDNADLIRTGANPRAVKVSPESTTFYVYNALDFTVDVFNAKSLQREATITVSRWSGSEEELLGKKLFYSAHPPMSSRRWISCSSCHPDGDSDGQTWQQPEGLRNTQAIFGLKETHPIHWSADRDEVQDFEHTIRSPLMQGRGLIRGPVSDSLGEPNALKSRELDALAAYANSHHFKMSPHAKQGLSESAARGKQIFHATETACAKCHSGSFYTDQKMHDVGTGLLDKTELIGTTYDTPTLLGIYRTAPYLHHGMAQTLEEVLVKYNAEDKHGTTSHLTKSEVTDLVEYLKALPYE